MRRQRQTGKQWPQKTTDQGEADEGMTGRQAHLSQDPRSGKTWRLVGRGVGKVERRHSGVRLEKEPGLRYRGLTHGLPGTHMKSRAYVDAIKDLNLFFD